MEGVVRLVIMLSRQVIWDKGCKLTSGTERREVMVILENCGQRSWIQCDTLWTGYSGAMDWLVFFFHGSLRKLKSRLMQGEAHRTTLVEVCLLWCCLLMTKLLQVLFCWVFHFKNRQGTLDVCSHLGQPSQNAKQVSSHWLKIWDCLRDSRHTAVCFIWKPTLQSNLLLYF